ncbi:MAG: hypothetical protein HFI66_02605 [Lachnospiraceae bacterium]|nr:hypothetical protein [Lachnospiraceae bacterium]
MRKHLKKMLDDLFQALDGIHEEIRKEIEQRNISGALHLLGQSQQGAIQAGTVIENEEGEGFPTIGLIEQYCEMLYQIYDNLSQGQQINPGKACKNLRKQLIRIQNSANTDIPVRTEAVFLPYKASMWDSLESVWRAADADPDCDAYVIPIPYYDKNPDGSFREIHYEGNDYPADVPVIDYKAYDFEKRHPDIIFIHNPYDDANFVTSVSPRFFSKNLKRYTDLLVYIPYFILGEVSPDNDEAIEGMKHFCITPGVLHAHKVIVQSEDMRQVYIKVLTKELGEQSRSYWEEKILGLGSPKVDKILNTRREDIEIPEEWRQIIEKPDGSFKRIILYNTTVSAILQNDRRMLKKMRQVFQIFKENQEDIVLLWRPHPLMKATIESMRPELWKEYKEILESYRAEGYGIYDDSPDLDRAIVLSDAYYGDWSSVVQLYEKTGKPIMIENFDVGQGS